MSNIGEIIREYILDVPKLERPVRGRIVKHTRRGETVYSWSVSHHWRGTAQALGTYHPSSTSDANIEDAEALLHAYMSGFEDAYEVKENGSY